MIASLVSAILAFALFTLTAVVIFHRKAIKRPILLMALLALLLAPLAVLLPLWLSSPEMERVIPLRWQVAAVSTLLFGFLYAVYMQIYGLVEFGISFRILLHFLRSPSHSLTFEELWREYPFDEVIQRKVGLAVKDHLVRVVRREPRETLANSWFWNLVGRFCLRTKEFLQWGIGG